MIAKMMTLMWLKINLNSFSLLSKIVHYLMFKTRLSMKFQEIIHKILRIIYNKKKHLKKYIYNNKKLRKMNF
jgi:hypothetical protein